MFKNKRKQAAEMAATVEAMRTVPRSAPKAQEVTILENEYRPCYVNGKKALFHRWVNTARPQLPKGQEPGENARYFQFRSTQAIVEYEDGTVDRVWPQDIQFADGGKFQDYAWLPMVQQQGGRHDTE